MQAHETKRDSTVISRARTAGVLDSNSDIHANTKSHRGMIHARVSSPEERRISCKQGVARQAESSVMLLVRLLSVMGFMQP